MFCEKCGADMGENKFCPECGSEANRATAQTITSEPVGQMPESRAKGGGLQENMAGLLCYILGWITGIIFILVDKRPFVRFHAMQSIITFGALSIFSFALGIVISLLPYSLARLLGGVSSLISLGSIVLAVFLILQAYQGKRFKLPVAGDMAEKTADGNKPAL